MSSGQSGSPTEQDARKLKQELVERAKELESNAQKLRSAAMKIVAVMEKHSSGAGQLSKISRRVSEETQKEMTKAEDLLDNLS